MTVAHSPLLRDRTSFQPVQWLLGLCLLPALTVGVLLMVGHPGLLISYTWNGNAAHPVYGSCDYLTATGWKVQHGACQLVKLFPVRM